MMGQIESNCVCMDVTGGKEQQRVHVCRRRDNDEMMTMSQ